MRPPLFKRSEVSASLALPHMSDDQVGGRDEEVGDPLESCADGPMHFSHARLWNHLCREQILQFSSCGRRRFGQQVHLVLDENAC